MGKFFGHKPSSDGYYRYPGRPLTRSSSLNLFIITFLSRQSIFFLAVSLDRNGASFSQTAFSQHSAQVSKPLAIQHLRTSHRQAQKYVLTPSALQPKQLICSGLISSVLFHSHHSFAVFARSSLSSLMVAILASHNSQSRPQWPISSFVILFSNCCSSAAPLHRFPADNPETYSLYLKDSIILTSTPGSKDGSSERSVSL